MVNGLTAKGSHASHLPPSPTIHDVARLANVSVATVSYVLSGRASGEPRISAQTSQLVLDAASRLGYVPNQCARSLRRQRTERVCLMLPHLGSPSYDMIARDLQRAADAHGYTVIIAVADSADRERQLLDQLRRRLADGALLVSPRSISASDLASVVRLGIAVVIYGSDLSAPGCDLARSSEADAAREALLHLAARGHRRIALIGDATTPSERDRLAMYRRILGERPFAEVEYLVADRVDSRPEAYHTTQRLLCLADRPTAILAMADIYGIGALLAAHDAGLNVPGDVAIIGQGNIAEGEITRPPLTTIGPDPHDYSQVAALLFTRLRGEAPPEGRVHVMARRLILRGSA